MSDDWEDEVFVLPSTSKAIGNEEDLLEKELAETSIARPADEAAIRHKAEQAEAAFRAKLEAAKEEDETPDQRRLRERRQVEEADHSLTNELFDNGNNGDANQKVKKAPGPTGNASRNFSSSGSGLGSIPLASNQDHFEFGNLVSVRLSDSTSFNIGAFYRGLSKVLKQNNVSMETIEEILSDIGKAKDAKVAAKDTGKGKKGESKKSQKDLKKESKRMEDIFGPSNDGYSKYSKYEDIEDDYM